MERSSNSQNKNTNKFNNNNNNNNKYNNNHNQYNSDNLNNSNETKSNKYFTVKKKDNRKNNYKKNDYNKLNFKNTDGDYNKVFEDLKRKKEYTNEEIEDIKLPITSFEDLDVSKEIIRGIFSHGFEQPSAIQCQAINPVLSGKDVIGQAQSGMGKTGTFCIGALGRIDENINAIQAIVLCHTRELAVQTENVFKIIG